MKKVLSVTQKNMQNRNNVMTQEKINTLMASDEFHPKIIGQETVFAIEKIFINRIKMMILQKHLQKY